MSATVAIVGNISREIELEYANDGTPVAKFSLACDVLPTTNDKAKKTNWYQVTATGRNAERIVRNLGRGSLLVVLGRLYLEAYISKDGEATISAEIRLREFQSANSFDSELIDEPSVGTTASFKLSDECASFKPVIYGESLIDRS